jgi:hypothetical protein
LPHQSAPVVSHNDPVWIQKWNNFEDKSIPEEQGLLILTHKEVNYAIHDE